MICLLSQASPKPPLSTCPTFYSCISFMKLVLRGFGKTRNILFIQRVMSKIISFNHQKNVINSYKSGVCVHTCLVIGYKSSERQGYKNHLPLLKFQHSHYLSAIINNSNDLDEQMVRKFWHHRMVSATHVEGGR